MATEPILDEPQALTGDERARLTARIDERAPGFLDDLLRDTERALYDGRDWHFTVTGDIGGRRLRITESDWKAYRRGQRK